MASKSNPIGMRVGITRDWGSIWFPNNKNNFAKLLVQDLKIRKYINDKLKDSGITELVITRDTGISKMVINIHTAKPGVVIGKSGKQIDDLKNEINRIFNINCAINVQEVSDPDLEAVFIAEQMATSIARKMPFRRVAKDSLQRAMQAGAKGIKIQIGGRLNGADIARSEKFSDGSVPLQTLRADISYSSKDAMTKYGKIGIKVWIYRGERFGKKENYTPNKQ